MHVYMYDELGALAGPIDPEVPGLGRLIPSNGIELEEPLQTPDEGKAWGLVEGVPTLLDDHRGTVYNVTTGAEEVWYKLGEIPKEYTTDPFPGINYIWSGTEWTLDLVADAQAQCRLLMEKANQATAGMMDAYIAGLLNEEDSKTFKAFAVYKLTLGKIDQQPGYPTSIDWPTSP